MPVFDEGTTALNIRNYLPDDDTLLYHRKREPSICCCENFKSHKLNTVGYVLFSVYRLQLEAPGPKPVTRKHHIANSPPYYGLEFHGVISHLDAAALLVEEGAYLVRQSAVNNGFYTLTLRCVVI